MSRLAVIVLGLVASIALCVVSAEGGVQRAASHGPGSRGLSAFAFDARNPQVVYAASGSGIFRSADAGKSWRGVNVGLTERYVYDVAVDLHRPATLYAATRSGVFKSTSGGGSWRKTAMPVVDTVSLALHPRDPRVVYAGTDDGVYKSDDAGASWEKVKTARRVFTIVLDPKRPATVYAGSGAGVFKSTDAGRSWQRRNTGLFPGRGRPTGQDLAEGYVAAMVINPRHPQTLYLGCEQGVFKSTDGARRWRELNIGVNELIGSLAIDPADPRTLYVGRYGLSKTADGGRNWARTGPPSAGYALALAVDPTNPATVYAGMSFGAKAFKSVDEGRSWTPLSIPVS